MKIIMDFYNVYFNIFCILIDFFIGSSLHTDNYALTSLYGDDYGTKWMYFPDEDGVLHYLNLTSSEDESSETRVLMTEDVEFRLYIKNDTESYILLDDRGKPINARDENTVFDVMCSKLPLKMITHGWRSSADREGVSSIKNAYIETQNVNIITVDWSIIASSIFYHWVANETKAIGARIASFMNELSYRYNVTGELIHLIGHSLGAHIMGIAASKTKVSVNRVTGLDPARPLFEYPPQDDSAKLDSSDGEFVDVIHTCGGLLGFEEAIGTTDFYPNKGVAPQPGCEDIVKFFGGCSHGRSFDYFTESIRYPTSFPAYQCKNWVEFVENRCMQYGYMGENVYRNMTGKYYLKTNAFEPFGKQPNTL